MFEDYQERPELDQYDPSMLDDAAHPAMTMEQRLAAESVMRERDRRDGRASP